MRRTTQYSRLFNDLGYREVLCGQNISVLVHETGKQYKCILVVENYGQNTVLSENNLRVIKDRVKKNSYFLSEKEFVFLTIIHSFSEKDKVKLSDQNIVFVMKQNKTIFNRVTADFSKEIAILKNYRKKEDVSKQLLQENQRSSKVAVAFITPCLACLCICLFLRGINNEKFAVSWNQLENQNWYSLITYSVFHSGWLHLISNMISFLTAGLYLEKRIGYVRYMLLLLISCVYSGFLSAFYRGSIGQSDVYTVGLSGVIYGIIGCMIIYSIYDKCFNFKRVLRILISLVIASMDKSIDNVCHVAGLMMGIYIGIICINFAKSKLNIVRRKYYKNA